MLLINIQLKFWTIISLLLMALMSPVFADSLWNEALGPFYGVSKKMIGVGDMVTIFISESAAASQEASTRTAKDSQIGSNFLSGWDQVANLLGNETIRKTHDFNLQGDDRFVGSGKTSRKSQINAVVTAVITEVMDNGNLFIVGEHNVKVNHEVQTIRISGIIRPEDIAPNNSVLSSQVAKKKVSFNGGGVIASKQSPGIVTKMFNWFF